MDKSTPRLQALPIVLQPASPALEDGTTQISVTSNRPKCDQSSRSSGERFFTYDTNDVDLIEARQTRRARTSCSTAALQRTARPDENRHLQETTTFTYTLMAGAYHC
jgi:hypothetical protein